MRAVRVGEVPMQAMLGRQSQCVEVVPSLSFNRWKVAHSAGERRVTAGHGGGGGGGKVRGGHAEML